MKKSILSIALISVFIVLSSCSVTQEIRVEGKPGTSIYDSNGKMLSTIDYSGSTTITMDRQKKYDYFRVRETRPEEGAQRRRIPSFFACHGGEKKIYFIC